MKAFFSRYGRALEYALWGVGWLVVALVLVAAVVMRWQVPRWPISDPDTWGYLAPALSWIDGLGFVQMHGRGWFYPAFTAGCLKLGSFSAIVVLQQLLGLISGVFFILAWQAWIQLLPPLRVLRAASPLLLSGFLAVFLLNPQTVLFEVQIRPEAVMNFVVFAQVFAVLRYVHARWRGGSMAAVISWGAAGILLAYMAFELKPSWALAVPLTCLPMGLGMIRRWRPFWPGVAAVGMAVVLMFSLLWLPKKIFFQTDVASQTFLPMVLFAIHADLINADMHEHAPPVTEKDREFMAIFDQEFANAKNRDHNYETLGFDPDYLMFGSSFFYTVKAYSGGTNESFAKFCKEAYLNAVKHNPTGFTRKILGQFAHFGFMKESTILRKRLDWQKSWQGSLPAIPAEATSYFKGPAGGMLAVYLEAVKPLGEKPQEVKGPPVLHELAKRIANALLVWEVLFVVAFGACFLWAPLANCRLAGAMALVLYGGPLGNALTVCIIHALDISRYRYSYGPPLLLAIAALMVFTLTVAGLAATAGVSRFKNARHP